MVTARALTQARVGAGAPHLPRVPDLRLRPHGAVTNALASAGVEPREPIINVQGTVTMIECERRVIDSTQRYRSARKIVIHTAACTKPWTRAGSHQLGVHHPAVPDRRCNKELGALEFSTRTGHCAARSRNARGTGCPRGCLGRPSPPRRVRICAHVG